MKDLQKDLEKRFWKFIIKGKKESDCWYWDGCVACKKTKPYGKISFKGKLMYAHRLSYKMHYGDFDQSLCVMHKCDNPRCCNPLHLELGTHLDNMRDMFKKGRDKQVKGRDWHKAHDGKFNPPKGERAGNTCLTEKDVINMREYFSNCKKRKEHANAITYFAEKYNMSEAGIKMIKYNKTWKHI